MFPINFNFPYRKKDGSLITMEKALDGAGADLDLIDLDDVAINTPTTGDTLQYNGTSKKWENKPIELNVDDLGDVGVTTPAEGDVLVYDDTDGEWKNSDVVTDIKNTMVSYEGNDTLKETRVFNVTVPSMDMGDTGAVKNFLVDYTGINYLGTNIINLRSVSNSQRVTFIISNSGEYSMAIMVSFYSRYMGGVMGDAALAAFWRYGTDWYYAPVNATWTQLS